MTKTLVGKRASVATYYEYNAHHSWLSKPILFLHTFTFNRGSLSVTSCQRNPVLSSKTSIHSPLDSLPIDCVPHILSTLFIHWRLRHLLTHGMHDNVHPSSRRSFVHPTVTPLPPPSKHSPAAAGTRPGASGGRKLTHAHWTPSGSRESASGVGDRRSREHVRVAVFGGGCASPTGPGWACGQSARQSTQSKQVAPLWRRAGGEGIVRMAGV